MVVQAIGLKTGRIYAQGINKREVNRKLIQRYTGVKYGGNINHFYTEPLYFKSENQPSFDLTITVHRSV